MMELFSNCRVNVITASGEAILIHREGKERRNEGGKEVNLTDLPTELISSSEDLISICKRKTNKKSDASHFGFIMRNQQGSDYGVN